MNNIHLDTKHQVFWLSYQYLTSQGIGENTISQWSKRNACKRKYIDGRAYINYDTIPVPTRKNLPAKDELKEEYNRQKSGYYESWYTRELKEAYESAQVPVWANLITNDKQYSKLKREQITSFARRAAVIEKAVELHKMHNAKGKLSGLYHAYTSLYKDYSRKNRFCMMLKKAKDKGVLSAAIDGRSIREFSPIYTAEYEQMAEMALSDRRSFDTAIALSEKPHRYLATFRYCCCCKAF